MPDNSKTKQKAQPVREITSAEWLLISGVAIVADLLGPFGLVLIPILLLWHVMRFHKFPTGKFIGAGIFEVLSLGVLPGWTGFIVMTYFEQKGTLAWFAKSAKKFK